MVTVDLFFGAGESVWEGLSVFSWPVSRKSARGGAAGLSLQSVHFHQSLLCGASPSPSLFLMSLRPGYSGLAFAKGRPAMQRGTVDKLHGEEGPGGLRLIMSGKQSSSFQRPHQPAPISQPPL